MLSRVIETCEFNNVNALKYLISKERTLGDLFEMAGRRTKISGGVRVGTACKESFQPFGEFVHRRVSSMTKPQMGLDVRGEGRSLAINR